MENEFVLPLPYHHPPPPPPPHTRTPYRSSPNQTKKSLGIASLVALIFFEVAGTPAGAENAVVAAGPRYALLGFLLMPLVWSVPEASKTRSIVTSIIGILLYTKWCRQVCSTKKQLFRF